MVFTGTAAFLLCHFLLLSLRQHLIYRPAEPQVGLMIQLAVASLLKYPLRRKPERKHRPDINVSIVFLRRHNLSIYAKILVLGYPAEDIQPEIVPSVILVLPVVAILCIIQCTVTAAFVVEALLAVFCRRDTSFFVFLPVGYRAGAVYTGNTDILRTSTLFHFLLSPLSFSAAIPAAAVLPLPAVLQILFVAG